VFEVNFYIWFFSVWIYIGVIFGFHAMKMVLKIINADKDSEEDDDDLSSDVSEMEESCSVLGKAMGASPIFVLFIFVYGLCILMWPYIVFMALRKMLK